MKRSPLLFAAHSIKTVFGMISMPIYRSWLIDLLVSVETPKNRLRSPSPSDLGQQQRSGRLKMEENYRRFQSRKKRIAGRHLFFFWGFAVV
jgi:hypothetical protein